jgi:uncharacterized protein (UPF0332 family)
MSTEKYLDLSKKYLGQAWEMLREGNYAKAGEMLWGATAEMVKALALQRGIELKSHGEIWEYIAKLSEETEDKEILKLFHVANGLHTNFYENWMPPKVVEEDAKFVETLIEKLKELIDNPTSPAYKE